MDADQIRAELTALGLESPKVRIGDTEGFYWAAVTRKDPNGQSHTHSTRLPLDPTPLDLQCAVAQLREHMQDE